MVRIDSAAATFAGSTMLRAWPEYAPTPVFSSANDVLRNTLRSDVVPPKPNFGWATAALPRAPLRNST